MKTTPRTPFDIPMSQVDAAHIYKVGWWLQPMRTVRTRDDLSFTCRDETGVLVNWEVPNDQNAKWSNCRMIGQRLFEEVEALALANEKDAFHAMVYAINSIKWRNTGDGIETGFAEAMASAAILGIRTLLSGADRYDIDAEILHGWDEEEKGACHE